MFAGWFPSILGPLVRPAIHAVLDDSVVEAFGFPRPSRALRVLMSAALKTRAWVLRWLPRRRRPLLRTQIKHRTYPEGYHIEQLGPPETG